MSALSEPDPGRRTYERSVPGQLPMRAIIYHVLPRGLTKTGSLVFGGVSHRDHTVRAANSGGTSVRDGRENEFFELFLKGFPRHLRPGQVCALCGEATPLNLKEPF